MAHAGNLTEHSILSVPILSPHVKIWSLAQYQLTNYLHAFHTRAFDAVVNVTKDDPNKICAKVVLERNVGSSESLILQNVLHSPNGVEDF